MEAEENGRKWVNDREAIAVLEAVIVALNNALHSPLCEVNFWGFLFYEEISNFQSLLNWDICCNFEV